MFGDCGEETLPSNTQDRPRSLSLEQLSMNGAASTMKSLRLPKDFLACWVGHYSCTKPRKLPVGILMSEQNQKTQCRNFIMLGQTYYNLLLIYNQCFMAHGSRLMAWGPAGLGASAGRGWGGGGEPQAVSLEPWTINNRLINRWIDSSLHNDIPTQKWREDLA